MKQLLPLLVAISLFVGCGERKETSKNTSTPKSKTVEVYELSLDVANDAKLTENNIAGYDIKSSVCNIHVSEANKYEPKNFKSATKYADMNKWKEVTGEDLSDGGYFLTYLEENKAMGNLWIAKRHIKKDGKGYNLFSMENTKEAQQAALAIMKAVK